MSTTFPIRTEQTGQEPVFSDRVSLIDEGMPIVRVGDHVATSVDDALRILNFDFDHEQPAVKRAVPRYQRVQYG